MGTKDLNHFIQPAMPYITWEHLGRKLKVWRRNGLSDSHCLKLLRLWVGYEFRDLMDSRGRYPRRKLNDLRLRLGYKNIGQLLADVRRSNSYYLTGKDNEDPDYLISIVWHDWEESDGLLLSGSFTPIASGKTNVEAEDEFSRKNGRNLRPVLNNNYNITNTTVGTAYAGTLSGNGLSDLNHEQQEKKRVVREYFSWLEQCTDAEHRGLLTTIKQMIAHPCDVHQKPLRQYHFSVREVEDIWNILITSVLPRYFMDREQFFSPGFMKEPERRIYWMQHTFPKYTRRQVLEAIHIWQKKAQYLEAEQRQTELSLIRQNRPFSEFEWLETDQNRYYLNQINQRMPIPADAPPRPSDNCDWNYIRQQWITRTH